MPLIPNIKIVVATALCFAIGALNFFALPAYAVDICGDAAVDVGEQCDDGNVTNGDGCSGVCVTETGFYCFASPSICEPADPKDAESKIPGIMENEVRFVDGNKYDFSKCRFVTQEICTSRRGYSACMSWHKQLAAEKNADTASIINQDKSFALFGQPVSVVADYYNCRHK